MQNIVERLEEKYKYYYKHWINFHGQYESIVACIYERAIEIVKKEGEIDAT